MQKGLNREAGPGLEAGSNVGAGCASLETGSEVMESRSITVAIVTARRDEDTSYTMWRSIREAFLEGRPDWINAEGKALALGSPERRHKYLSGEFGALLYACLDAAAVHHVIYQLRSLQLQTRKPDRIVVVSRQPVPITPETEPCVCLPPMLSALELERSPASACAPFMALRRTPTELGCSDKNTALIVAPEGILVMLDDCCLASPGLLAAAEEICVQGDILFPAHRKLTVVERDGALDLVAADANTDLVIGHRVFGVFASPLEYLLAINGWNTRLGGTRGGDDAEMLIRMESYRKTRGFQFRTHPGARLYEIEHTAPWNKGDVPPCNLPEVAVEGWHAPGPDLREIRKIVLQRLREENSDAGEETTR